MPHRAADVPSLTDRQVERYLARLGLDAGSTGRLGRDDLDAMCLAHLVRVPFENLDQVFGDGVQHDLDAAVTKVLAGRGGWCFELNGAFARLLTSLGLDVLLLGAAVLLDGPSARVEHLALEVSGGPSDLPPLLVDVGFGDSFVRPLELNRAGPQDGGNGTYEFLASPQGTTLTRLVDGIPAATLRFKRVALDFDDLADEADRLQRDPTLRWSRTPFATRLVDVDHRITLRGDTRTTTVGDRTERITVTSPDDWDRVLDEWFGLRRPGPWPTDPMRNPFGRSGD